jgi:hypothetical protein
LRNCIFVLKLNYLKKLKLGIDSYLIKTFDRIILK